MTRRPGVPQPSAAEDGGAATTEMVLVMPVLIMFLFLVVAAGRLTDAKSDVVSAANDAARVASLQGSESAALLDLPGVVTVTEHGWEPIDTHRSL
jgi:Flp pilus assembly protein TadG